MMEIRCGRCGYWIGESLVPLANVEQVRKSEQATVRPPRDMRVCRSCGVVNVLVEKTRAVA